MNYKFKTKPYDHQLSALKKSWNKENFAYFMEMGTGKSKVLIDNVSMLYDKGKINGLLLIAPKGVYKNWFDSEIPTHMVDHIDKKMVLWQANINKGQQLKLDTLFETVAIDLAVLLDTEAPILYFIYQDRSFFEIISESCHFKELKIFDK